MKRVAKFINDHTSMCLHCHGYLKPVAVEKNPHHIYDIGTRFQCKCGKSRIWTNSIRGEKNLLKFFDGLLDYYHNGFCNDLFCGFTHKPIDVLKNGIQVKGVHKGADLIGNSSHATNNKIAHWFDKEWDSSETGGILEWYKEHRAEVEALMPPEEKDEVKRVAETPTFIKVKGALYVAADANQERILFGNDFSLKQFNLLASILKKYGLQLTTDKLDTMISSGTLSSKRKLSPALFRKRFWEGWQGFTAAWMEQEYGTDWYLKSNALPERPEFG